MSENINHTVDKSGWPDGPWMTEPDRVQWQHAGYACLIMRGPVGALCGYVGIPEDHPCFGKHYDSCEVEGAHCGLTYSDACSGSICHIPEPGMPDKVWWLGFDCAHYGDICPSIRRLNLRYDYRETYKDVAYVMGCCNEMAMNLRLTQQKAVSA